MRLRPTGSASERVALPPASPATLVRARGLSVVGRALPRHDAVHKVTGQLLYAADWQMPGMLHAKVVRSPHPCAMIRRIDRARALAVPGALAVITAGDVPANAIEEDPSGMGLLRRRMPVLASDEVRYQWQPVAVVVGESEEAAEAAAEALDVDYVPRNGVYTVADALAPDAPHVDPAGNVLIRWKVRKGDVEQGFARADVVVEETYQSQLVDHAYLEPEAGVGWVDADGVITLRVSTQVIEHYRAIARVLGLPESKVRVIGAYLGGGFGGKEDMTVELYLALAVWKTRRPVRMVWTRQESLLARPKRHAFTMRYRTGATRNGVLVAQQCEITADAGAYPYLSGRVLLAGCMVCNGPYRIPHVRVDAQAVLTNNVPASAMRGFGAMQVTLAYESQMDLLARELGIEADELRRRNYLRKGEEMGTGQKVPTHVALPEILDRALAALGEPARPDPARPHTRVGRGFAVNIQPYGRQMWFLDQASAWVGVEQDGSAVVRAGVPDVGAGQAAALCQIAAEELGVPVDRVSVHIADSALTPLVGGTFATRQLYMSGNAVWKAARELRERLLGVASQFLEVPLADLDLRDGQVWVAGRSEPAMTMAQLAAECRRQGVPVEHLAMFREPGTSRPFNPAAGQGDSFPDFTFGAHAVEVEVDTETGEVRLLKHAACHDVGRALNPQTVEGQIQGGAAMGVGYALSEEIVLREGVNQSGLFASYLIPTAADVPDIQAIAHESGEGKGPFGARGIGEPPVGPPAAAIASAIENAVGVRITRLPITPERVLDALSRRDGTAG